jgi:glycosyltransferase involved in cell wall biosynthesis
VIKITYPIALDEKLFVSNKEKFSIKKDSFTFLFIFDFMSIFERKNPLATINAFKSAFAKNENVTLVLKYINGDFAPQKELLLKSTCNDPRIKIIDHHISKSDVLSLKASCDCYVSLHRSEGFGLTMAEAMYIGKPVIGTPYGGNTDFMNVNNSFLVKYDIKELEEDYGSYKKGNVWAEPDVNDAAELMRFVYEHPEIAAKVGYNASNFIKKYMNPHVTGSEILTRVDRLR